MKLPPQSKYPKQIYFSHEVYKIKFVKGLEHFGDTDPNKKLIRIKHGISARATFVTLIHELLHVIEFEEIPKLKHSTIYALEKAISELLFDNFI